MDFFSGLEVIWQIMIIVGLIVAFPFALGGALVGIALVLLLVGLVVGLIGLIGYGICLGLNGIYNTISLTIMENKENKKGNK